MALKLRPGGSISPFCEPASVTSRPHSSCRSSIEPSDETASTSSSAGWPARSIARRISGSRLVDAGRRLVVHDQHGAGCGGRDPRAAGFERRRIDAVPPVSGHDLDVEPDPPRHLGPAPGELADVERQHPIAGRQRVDERRFPRAGARRGKDHDRPGGLEDPLRALEHLASERREFGAAMIDGRLRHRAQHAIGRVGRSGDLKEVTSALVHGQGS